MSRSPKVLLLAIVAALATLGISGVAGAAVLNASLSGRAETPLGDRNGSGTARITTKAAERRVCFRITLSRVGTVTAGHIHEGRRGRNGDVVVPLFDTATRRPRGCARGVSRSLIRAIVANPRRYYVNVHNSRYPAGAARGQLRRR